jgi:hypothetical protein
MNRLDKGTAPMELSRPLGARVVGAAGELRPGRLCGRIPGLPKPLLTLGIGARDPAWPTPNGGISRRAEGRNCEYVGDAWHPLPFDSSPTPHGGSWSAALCWSPGGSGVGFPIDGSAMSGGNRLRPRRRCSDRVSIGARDSFAPAALLVRLILAVRMANARRRGATLKERARRASVTA